MSKLLLCLLLFFLPIVSCKNRLHDGYPVYIEIMKWEMISSNAKLAQNPEDDYQYKKLMYDFTKIYLLNKDIAKKFYVKLDLARFEDKSHKDYLLLSDILNDGGALYMKSLDSDGEYIVRVVRNGMILDSIICSDESYFNLKDSHPYENFLKNMMQYVEE